MVKYLNDWHIYIPWYENHFAPFPFIGSPTTWDIRPGLLQSRSNFNLVFFIFRYKFLTNIPGYLNVVFNNLVSHTFCYISVSHEEDELYKQFLLFWDQVPLTLIIVAPSNILFGANYQLKMPYCLAILLDFYVCTTNESSNMVELSWAINYTRTVSACSISCLFELYGDFRNGIVPQCEL